MRTSGSVLALCALAMLVVASAQQFDDPCHRRNQIGRYTTRIESYQGLWVGRCITQQAPIDPANNPMGPAQCVPAAYEYPFEIAFNGTASGAAIGVRGQPGFLPIPVGGVVVLDSAPVDRTWRSLLLNFTVDPVNNIRLPGMAHTQVSCHEGRPTYVETTIHRLAAPLLPTTFPFPQRRDLTVWCNDRTTEVNENAPLSFTIVCMAERVGEIPRGWPQTR